MTPIEIRRRNRYLLQLREELERFIYAEREKVRQEKIDDIIVRNSALLGFSAPSFMYKQTMYTYWNARPDKGSNRTIHEDILPEIIALIDNEDFDVFEEENRIMTYLSNVISTARCMDDLWELIPSRVSEPLNAINHDVVNMGPPMSEAELDKFKEDNYENYRAFKRLFLEQLLMA